MYLHTKCYPFLFVSIHSTKLLSQRMSCCLQIIHKMGGKIGGEVLTVVIGEYKFIQKQE